MENPTHWRFFEINNDYLPDDIQGARGFAFAPTEALMPAGTWNDSDSPDFMDDLGDKDDRWFMSMEGLLEWWPDESADDPKVILLKLGMVYDNSFQAYTAFKEIK